MDKQDLDSDDTSTEFEPPDPDDIEALVAFYERTGVMPVSSIGPPIERPIIPSRRPDRVGDFNFTIGTGTAHATPSGKEEAEEPEAEKIRQEYLDLLNEELKGL